MTVNPYITEEYDPPTAPTSRPSAARSDAGRGRKINRLTLAGAMIGLLIGLLTTSWPDLEAIAPFDQGRAIGHVLGRVLGAMLLGCAFAWWLRLLFSRTVFALLLFGGAVALGGAVTTHRELPTTMDFTPLPTNGLASLDSISFARKPIDLARHQEARRVQFEDYPFSVILPSTWKQVKRESDHVIYAGSTGVAFLGSVGMKVHPKRGRLTAEAIQDSIVKSTPGFVNFLGSGEIMIDAKRAFFVACHVRMEGRNIRQVVYLVSGESKLYELTVSCNEPPTASSRNTLGRVVKSLRVD